MSSLEAEDAVRGTHTPFGPLRDCPAPGQVEEQQRRPYNAQEMAISDHGGRFALNQERFRGSKQPGHQRARESPSTSSRVPSTIIKIRTPLGMMTSMRRSARAPSAPARSLRRTPSFVLPVAFATGGQEATARESQPPRAQRQRMNLTLAGERVRGEPPA
jgi:hypothetical protein